MGTEPQTAWMKIKGGGSFHWLCWSWEKYPKMPAESLEYFNSRLSSHRSKFVNVMTFFGSDGFWMSGSLLFFFAQVLPLSWCWWNSQPASEPAPLCPDLLCNWKTWREADSGGGGGGVSSLKPKCLFSASVLNSLAEMSRHSHLSPAPGKLLPASRSVLVFLSWFNLLWWSCYPCQGSGWECDAWKSWLNVNSVGKKLSLWQRPVSGLFLPLVVGGLLLKAFNMTFFPWNFSWAVSKT